MVMRAHQNKAAKFPQKTHVLAPGKGKKHTDRDEKRYGCYVNRFQFKLSLPELCSTSKRETFPEALLRRTALRKTC